MKRGTTPAQVEQLKKLHQSNKGKTRTFTDEWIKNLSASHQGQRVSVKTEFKKGHASPWKGKRLPEYAKKKMALAKIGKKASAETKRKMSEGRKGSKHHAWKGGISSDNSRVRTSTQYRIWAQTCLINGSFTCKQCGQVGGKLEVHHLKPFHVLIKEAVSCLSLLTMYDAAMIYSPLWETNNGQVLCVKCHSKIDKKRKA